VPNTKTLKIDSET